MTNSLYTKEVMKHFQDPHNMGSIKNADGIGEVGNAGFAGPHTVEKIEVFVHEAGIDNHPQLIIPLYRFLVLALPMDGDFSRIVTAVCLG